jgi:hypothetical protein
MRLTKIKLAGFKSFVDPTSVHFPGNLTGVDLVTITLHYAPPPSVGCLNLE